MAKQLSNLQQETRIYLDEATETDFLGSEVLIAINRGYHETIGFVIEVYEDFYTTTSPFKYAVVQNQQEYAIDSSLIKVTRVEINFNPTVSGSQPARAIPIKMDEIRSNLANTNNASGSFFSAGYYINGVIGAQIIGFIPVPSQLGDTGSNKSISVWGVALPTDLVNTTDNINIPYADRFSYLVSLRAAAQLLRKGQQEEAAAARYLAEYRAGVVDMMTFLKERQADDMWVITDNQLEDIDFSTMEII